MQTPNRSVLFTGEGRVVVAPAEPLVPPGPRQARIRVLVAAVSTGTETTILRQRRADPDPNRPAAALGYSVAGVVEATGPEYAGPPAGSRVACYGGPYVRHADYCVVGQNLIAPVPDSVPIADASFGGIGAIALHAVRNGHLQIGERIGVLGLGVVGQVVAQLARQSGAWVLAADPLPARRERARGLGAADEIVEPADWAEAAKAFTAGRGLDAALVCAGTPEDAGPAVAALEALRFHGRLVVVGNVRTHFPREILFQKEAQVIVSRAAGPGRYDPDYERESHDLPPGIVPWTEGRNLRCFVELLAGGRVRVAPLVTATLPMEQAADTFDRLMERPAETLAILLRFTDQAL